MVVLNAVRSSLSGVVATVCSLSVAIGSTTSSCRKRAIEPDGGVEIHCVEDRCAARGSTHDPIGADDIGGAGRSGRRRRWSQRQGLRARWNLLRGEDWLCGCW
jgi:hypothetical protein